MLKELKMESQKDQIKKENENTEICKFHNSTDRDEIRYDCEFIFQ
jgi:hypothetical protein